VTIDEAIRELLAVSTDIRQVAVVDELGVVSGVGPGADPGELAAALDELWRAAGDAAARGGDVALEHLVVDLGDAAVVALAAGGRRIVALTAPDPVLGLALFDLRTCLADAFPPADEEPA
jgi:predicted regulator of Ras-like GTPase activity (Roadblock/LC7/MglB family)